MPRVYNLKNSFIKVYKDKEYFIEMNVFLTFFCKNVYSANSNQNSYICVDFFKEVPYYIKNELDDLSKQILTTRWKEVKKKIRDRNLCNNAFFYSCGNNQVFLKRLLKYILYYYSPSIVNNIEKSFNHICFTQYIINHECTDSLYDNTDKGIKYEIMDAIILRIEPYIKMYWADKIHIFVSNVRAFEIANKLFFGVQAGIKTNPSQIINTNSSTISSILLEKLKFHSIQIDEFFSPDYDLINAAINLFTILLEKNPEGDIFILVNFQVETISHMAGKKYEQLNVSSNDVDSYLSNIRNCKTIMEKILKPQGNIDKLRMIIKENPRLNIANCCFDPPFNPSSLKDDIKCPVRRHPEKEKIEEYTEILANLLMELESLLKLYIDRIFFGICE